MLEEAETLSSCLWQPGGCYQCATEFTFSSASAPCKRVPRTQSYKAQKHVLMAEANLCAYSLDTGPIELFHVFRSLGSSGFHSPIRV